MTNFKHFQLNSLKPVREKSCFNLPSLFRILPFRLLLFSLRKPRMSSDTWWQELCTSTQVGIIEGSSHKTPCFSWDLKIRRSGVTSVHVTTWIPRRMCLLVGHPYVQRYHYDRVILTTPVWSPNSISSSNWSGLENCVEATQLTR